MGIIESLKNQDLEQLKQDVVKSYKYFYKTETMRDHYFIHDFEDWFPSLDKRDSLFLVEIIEHIAPYWNASYDSVLHTFEIYLPIKPENELRGIGNGLDFPQSVCNAFVDFYHIYLKNNTNT